MCKWCENYRFTINATSKKNLIDHGNFYVPANYCPVCGTLLKKKKKNDNDTETKTEEQVYIAKSGHPGGSLSCADI